jgi:extracellular factor (EF) 3-hydroxypalmitic acid methyl ester biosynthesis protein
LNSPEDQINYIEKNKSEIFRALDDHFYKIWLMVQKFSDFEYKVHQKYYQNQLLPLLCTPPLNKRIYEKPLGYNGDYITMGYYYQDGYEGNTLYEKLIHRYTLSIPIARAVIKRLDYFYNQMCDIVLKFDDPVYISSIGSGPAREMVEFIKNNPHAERCIFSCLDSEGQALEKIKNDLREVKESHKREIRVNFFNHNILQFIKKTKNNVYPPNQHLIYASGLFDYLNDKVASCLIKSMFSLLAEGGKIVITNFHKNISSRAYLEFLGEWYLILRDEQNMLHLVRNIKNLKEKRIEIDDTGSQLFLTLQK